MKLMLTILLFLSSASAFAECEAGQLTVLTSKIEFQRIEADGKELKISLPAGSEVHIVSLSKELVGLFATSQIQGQNLSFTSAGFASDVLKVLRCSSAKN